MSHDTITRDEVLVALSRHIGGENGASARALVAEIRSVPTPGHERQLRHRIEELRREGHHVCGHPSSGYYIAATEEELVRTCGYLHDRAMTSLTQIAAMRRVSLPDLRGQLRIPEHTASRGQPHPVPGKEGSAMNQAGESPERVAVGGDVGAQCSRSVESRADQPAVSHNTGSASALPLSPSGRDRVG